MVRSWYGAVRPALEALEPENAEYRRGVRAMGLVLSRAGAAWTAATHMLAAAAQMGTALGQALAAKEADIHLHWQHRVEALRAAAEVCAAWDGFGLLCGQLGVQAEQLLRLCGARETVRQVANRARDLLAEDDRYMREQGDLFGDPQAQSAAAGLIQDRKARRAQRAREYANLLREQWELLGRPEQPDAAARAMVRAGTNWAAGGLISEPKRSR